ncbi:MAG: TlpA family protein disulfide reductase [Oscillospiraceae bacterium]|nr:TlpA family protein disulfide reductase [Oscillospiraceae bacterium]
MSKKIMCLITVFLILILTSCSASSAKPVETTADTTALEALAFPFAFTAENVFGNTVTEETLGERELFFVHYWATWCAPCVQEMPDLAKIAEEYSDRVGFIGLVSDFGSNSSGAKNIAETSGVPQSFIMVDAENEALSPLLSMVQSGYVPTTVIIDGNGKMLTAPLIGAYGELYGTVLDTILGVPPEVTP